MMAGRSELVTTYMSRQIEHSNHAVAGLDCRLDQIQHILLRTHDAFIAQVNTVNCIKNSIPSPKPVYLTTENEMSMIPRRSHEDRDTNAPYDGLDESWEQEKADTGLDRSSDTCFETSTHMQSSRLYKVGVRESSDRLTVAAPTSHIETSRNFFPETYTVEQRLPRSCLVVISSYEQESSLDVKSNFYRLFFMYRTRQWCRLNISIGISRCLAYWATARTSQGEHIGCGYVTAGFAAQKV